jgi:hypothetical protein
MHRLDIREFIQRFQTNIFTVSYQKQWEAIKGNKKKKKKTPLVHEMEPIQTSKKKDGKQK